MADKNEEVEMAHFIEVDDDSKNEIANMNETVEVMVK